ncbi:neurotrophin 1 isoform X1 [Vespula squamosa]|uniref:Neurotrophin 1 isoform X1 n=1 Tax=Vespula squamosa TaxID=30214 RepID=A0ABD2AI97_VESSQ
MAKIRLGVDYHPFKIVIMAVLLFWIADKTNSDSQPNFYEKYDLDRPSYPSWYKRSPFMEIIEPKDNMEERLFFPENDMKSQIQNLENPHICKNKTYCEDTPYYPTELVKNKLENIRNLMEFAIKDYIPTQIDLSHRIDANDETPMCVSTEKLIYPKTAETVNGNWLYIAQMKEDFSQGIRVETCVGNSKPCRYVQDVMGRVSTCEQKYIYRQLLAINKEDITTELFRFPSSCCCNVRNV